MRRDAQTNVRLSQKMKERIMRIAEEQDRTLSEILRESLNLWLEQYEHKQKQAGSRETRLQ